MSAIRNFCIIAHIDHGKSTLADRLLDFTGAVSSREKQDQLLDNMDIERERGITIKSHAIQMNYSKNGEDYVLNLIDTPGHVDFSYEVSRSIAACEGALLVVDAAQNIQAQTISNLYLALENDLEIIPVLNKVDLPSANPEEVSDDIIDLLGCKKEEIIHASAKTGLGIEEILDAIISVIPEPETDSEAPLKALIFDSVYNPFRGVETYFRVFSGQIEKGQSIKFLATQKKYNADEVGTLNLTQTPKKCIKAGDVGYLITGIKNAKEVKVGDTIINSDSQITEGVSGFEDVKPMVFAGIYPVDTEEYEDLRSSMEKLQLNDASLVFIPESSSALGFGFRCGFLGTLHLEVVRERLEREYDLSLISSAPSVQYQVLKTDGELIDCDSPSQLPPMSNVDEIREPFVIATILTPKDYVGNVITLCTQKRGTQKEMTYFGNQVSIVFEIPLAEVIIDFFDRLKSTTKGYASIEYNISEFHKSDLIKLDVLLNNEIVDALSMIIHKDFAMSRGRQVAKNLQKLIPRQMFDVPIQVAIGSKIISRETVKAFRKNVTAKLYGGDVTRKKKLLEKQKEGKKKMKQFGRVSIPQEAFLNYFSSGDK